MPSPHAFSPASMQPTRRTLVRSAAWTVPAVSLAVAAPAYAVSNFACPTFNVTWGLSTIPTAASVNAGDLTWEITQGVLLVGSTITLTITTTDQYTYDMFFKHMATSITGPREAPFPNPGKVNPSAERSLVVVFNVTQDLLPTASIFITIQSGNPTPELTFDPQSSYSVAWAISPASPTDPLGVAPCATVSGSVGWTSPRSFTGP